MNTPQTPTFEYEILERETTEIRVTFHSNNPLDTDQICQIYEGLTQNKETDITCLNVETRATDRSFQIFGPFPVEASIDPKFEEVL